MSKHTPGAWESWAPFKTGSGYSNVIGTSDKTIAAVFGGSTIEEMLVGQKNARLIAAAPLLLEALTKVRDRFFPIDQPERDRDLLWYPVNAAIAAAEGNL